MAFLDCVNAIQNLNNHLERFSDGKSPVSVNSPYVVGKGKMAFPSVLVMERVMRLLIPYL